MGLTEPFTGMVTPAPLGPEETAQAVRLDVIAELDAVDLYQAHLNAIEDPKVRQTLEHVRDEEKQHAAEFLSVLETLDPYQAQMLRERQPVMDLSAPPGLADFDSQVNALDERIATLALPTYDLPARADTTEQASFVPAIPTVSTPVERGYLYHATNRERAYSIATEGLQTHKPWQYTEQNAWPDGSTERRVYLADGVIPWMFAPEEGRAVLLRVPRGDVHAKRESTGDYYTTRPIRADKLQVLGDDGEWYPMSAMLRGQAFPHVTPPVYHTLNIWVKGGLGELWQREKDTLIASDLKLSPNRAGELAAAKLMRDAGAEMKAIEEYVRLNDVPEINDLYDAWQARSDRSTLLSDLVDLSKSRTLLADVDKLATRPQAAGYTDPAVFLTRDDPPGLVSLLREHDHAIDKLASEIYYSVPAGQHMGRPVMPSESIAERRAQHWDLLRRDAEARVLGFEPILRPDDIERLRKELAVFQAYEQREESPLIPAQYRPDAISEPDEREEYDVAATSLRQVPALFHKVPWQSGTVNADLGGGEYDDTANFLASQGVESVAIDHYHRPHQHNKAVEDRLYREPADTATMADLDAIADPATREQAIAESRSYVKQGGTVYFSEANGSGNGQLTTYLPEIQAVYPDAHREDGYIVATAPYVSAMVVDVDGHPVRPTAVLGTLQGEKCIADAPLPGETLSEWVSGIGGEPGIVVDPGLARTTACTRIDLGPGQKGLVYSPGIIGALDDEQQALYCQAGTIDREATAGQRAHLQAMSEAAKICALQGSQTDPRERLEAYFSCLGRELARKEANKA